VASHNRGDVKLLYSFEDFVLDTEQRELHRGAQPIPMQPQVFDLLEYFVANRHRVVSKDDIIATVWGGRIVSESALTTRVNAVRTAVGDSGAEQRLIKTLPRKGVRFIGAVSEIEARTTAAVAEPPLTRLAMPVPNRSSSAERRQLTVVACELLFGARTHIDPEDLRDAISAFHQWVKETANRFTGVVGNSMDRTVLVHFGYPEAHEDDAEQAVHAGLALCAGARHIDPHGNSRLHTRVGVATGQVVVGDESGGELQACAPVGEAPSRASQLQNAASPDTVLIDSTTRHLIGGLFNCREIDPIRTSGTSEALQGWQVLGAGSVDSRFEALRPSAFTPLIGRDEELELLLRRWTQVKSGDGRVVLISGEAGIGKSRIVAELQTRIQSEEHEHLRFFCSPNLRDSVLRPVVMRMERAAGFENDDDPVVKLDKLVRMLMPTLTSDEHVGIFADLLAIPGSGAYQLPNLAPQLKREKIFDALLWRLEALAQKQPVFVLFEDVHWIDPTSHELLDRLVDLTARLPILLLATFRPEFRPLWVGKSHVTSLTMNRLSRREGAALIAEVAGKNSLSETLIEKIVERTDGVPLFVEELTKAVLEAGGEDQGQNFIYKIPSHDGVPTTLQPSLMARLDRLGLLVKEIAQVGAAIGREFSYDLLSAATKRSQDELQTALDQLTDSGLVTRRGTPSGTNFTFKHALVQEAAYETLLRPARQRLHARIANVLEIALAKQTEAQPELLARHFSEAALPEKAQAYWLRASQIAAARSASIEAVAHATRGLEQLKLLPASISRDRMELALRSARGPALIATRGYAADETVEDYERARELIRITGDETFWDIVLTGLLVAYYNRGAYRRALDVAFEFMQHAESTRDPVALCIGHRLLAGPYSALGEFASSETHGEAAFSYYDFGQHRHLAWRYVHDIGVAAASQWAIGAWHSGHISVANRARSEALRIAAQLEHHNTTGYALYYNGVLASFRQREFPALAQYSANLLDHASRHNLPQWTAWTSALEGVARAHAGKVEEGIAALESGIMLCDKIKNQSMRTVFLAALAETQLIAGNYKDVERTLGAAFDIAERTDERWMDAELWRLRAELALSSLGQSGGAEAEQHLKCGIGIAERQGSNSFKLRLTTKLAQLSADQKQIAKARRMLASVLESFSDGYDTPDLMNAKALLVSLTRR
jgi:predicted ATPase/DNA-binding winged helix-turn-helix (wHTH) protein